MKRPIALLAVSALALLAAPLDASAGPALRRGGKSVGTSTLNFSFDNTQALGLMRLSFFFDDGEHGLSWFGHMVGVGAAHNWFSGETPAQYEYDAKHYPRPGRVLTAHRSGCKTSCVLGIPKVPADKVLVLAGFLFESPDGSEHEIASIGVVPAPADGKIAVEFSDNTNFTFDATVQYALLPAADIVDGKPRSFTKTSSAKTGRVINKWNDRTGSPSPSLLHGFSARFKDGKAHALHRFSLSATSNKAALWMHGASASFDLFEATMSVAFTKY